MYARIKELLLQAGLELRKWCSNNVNVQKQILDHEPDDQVGKPFKHASKILGLTWDKTEDKLNIQTSNVYKESAEYLVSKRNVLKTVASLYDPIGVISPIVILFKLFFQKLVGLKCSWDEELPSDLIIEWCKLRELLKKDELFQINRFYFTDSCLRTFEKFTLHGFADASERAYAAVIYIVGDSKNERRSSFVVSKTKIAPAKKLSMPRLELCACLLLSKLMFTVMKALSGIIQVDRKVLWSDAMDALFWIKHDTRKRKIYIENRVKVIRKMMGTEDWRYCPTDLNVADIPSRGLKSVRKIEAEISWWLSGPDFIKHGDETWPVDMGNGKKEGNDGSIENEIIVNCTFESPTEVVCLHIRDGVTEKPKQKIRVFQGRMKLHDIIEAERFSTVQRLLRVTVLVLRFVRNLQPKMRKEETVTGYVTLEEIQDAEIAWVKSTQIKFEGNSKQLNNTLGLFLDERGVIVCKGRMEKADLTPNQIHPILIPGDTHFAWLLIVDAHIETRHGGKKETITQLRSKYWVTRARKMVQQVLRSCGSPCNRLESRPFKSMEASPLPGFRVRQSFPFANSAVDYAGPLLVHDVFGTCDQMNKVWVVLYTCAVTRAIHLDLVPDLSSSAFLRSLRRFIGRRGIPNLMISDNASCFKSDEVKLNEELVKMHVKWKFIIEASPWWGGFWERLVRTVKRSLRKVLFRASVNYEELETIIIDVEGIVNSRPLTYIYDDDLDEILTPSHLLLGRRLLSRFDEEFDVGEDVNNFMLTKRMKYVLSLSTQIWNRFRDEYLLDLRSHHVQGSEPKRSPEIGEIVVVESKSKRNEWRLGKVIESIPGSDGRSRGVILRTFDGVRSRYIKRPIERLYPIEVKSETGVSDEEKNMARLTKINEVTYNENQNVHTDDATRPYRTAAENGIITRRLAGC